MGTDQFDWKRMSFKGNKVWLQVDKEDNAIVKNGKVLIKYQKKQDYEYWVHEDTVKIIDPSTLKKKGTNRKTLKKKTHKSPESDQKKYLVPDGGISVYTDGATSGNPGPSGIGVVLRFKDHIKEISENIGIATNNIAELKAIQAGLLEIKNKDLPVRLFTDSGYSYGLLVLGWKAKKNVELVQTIKTLMKQFKDLKLIKVKGHAGIPDNELADTLATSAVNKG